MLEEDAVSVLEQMVPWWDSEKWKPGEWYPMPFGFMARDQEEYIIEGYGIYTLDPEGLPSDMMPILSSGSMAFSTALEVCEAHNGRRMLR